MGRDRTPRRHHHTMRMDGYIAGKCGHCVRTARAQEEKLLDIAPSRCFRSMGRRTQLQPPASMDRSTTLRVKNVHGMHAVWAGAGRRSVVGTSGTRACSVTASTTP